MEHHLVEPVDVADDVGGEELLVVDFEVYLDVLGLDLDEEVLKKVFHSFLGLHDLVLELECSFEHGLLVEQTLVHQLHHLS